VKYRVGVLSGTAAAAGFHLAGLEPTVTDSPDAARRVLEEMMEDASVGVILVQEDLAPDLGVSSPRHTRTGLPLLIPFPAPASSARPGEAEAYVTELLRRAIGYRVRLQ